VNELPDSLVRVVQALVDDDDLALWFESLEDMTVSARFAEIRATVARMRQIEGVEEIAHATSLLGAPQVYESVLGTVRELRAAK
jgi:hypothetical protein